MKTIRPELILGRVLQRQFRCRFYGFQRDFGFQCFDTEFAVEVSGFEVVEFVEVGDAKFEKKIETACHKVAFDNLWD